MSFYCLGRFPAEAKGECCPKIQAPTCELPLVTSLEDAMYIWWKIYKVRYTYNWNYASGPGGSVNVSGSGSVIMDGGIQYMSDKVCPQEITYTCKQRVHYTNSYPPPGIEEDVDDTIYLTISSAVSQNENDSNIWYPNISLIVYPGHTYYDAWQSSCFGDQTQGLIDCFGFGSQYLIDTSSDLGYGVSIQLSVEQESVAA